MKQNPVRHSSASRNRFLEKEVGGEMKNWLKLVKRHYNNDSNRRNLQRKYTEEHLEP